MTSSIYYIATDRCVKQGWTDDLPRRVAEHKRTFEMDHPELVAAMSGTFDTEKRLKGIFEPHRVREGSAEEFRLSSPVLEYVLWLLNQGYASPDPDVAITLPELPWSCIDPENLPKPALAGQLTIESRIEPRARLSIAAKQAQNHSLSDEWYTPEPWITMARESMGSIDCDPSTSAAVNARHIKAPVFYTREMNGLDLRHPWAGNVWLNPPYGRGEGSAGDFCARLRDEVRRGTVTQAVTCLNLASMSTEWFRTTIGRIAVSHCIPARVAFEAPRGVVASSPNKGTIFSYLGPRVLEFERAFAVSGGLMLRDAGKQLGLFGMVAQ